LGVCTKLIIWDIQLKWGVSQKSAMFFVENFHQHAARNSV